MTRCTLGAMSARPGSLLPRGSAAARWAQRPAPIERTGKRRILDLDHRLGHLEGEYLSLIDKSVDHTDGEPIGENLTLNEVRPITPIDRCQFSDHGRSVRIRTHHFEQGRIMAIRKGT